VIRTPGRSTIDRSLLTRKDAFVECVDLLRRNNQWRI
jgi:hypothetical protein